MKKVDLEPQVPDFQYNILSTAFSWYSWNTKVTLYGYANTSALGDKEVRSNIWIPKTLGVWLSSYLLTVWASASHSAPLWFCFLICKLEIVLSKSGKCRVSYTSLIHKFDTACKIRSEYGKMNAKWEESTMEACLPGLPLPRCAPISLYRKWYCF